MERPSKVSGLNLDVGGATIIWTGKPLFVPLRHIRQHAEGLYHAMFLENQSVFLDSALSGLAPRPEVGSGSSVKVLYYVLVVKDLYEHQRACWLFIAVPSAFSTETRPHTRIGVHHAPGSLHTPCRSGVD